MLSYRDPNLCDTIGIYHQAASFLQSSAVDEDDVERAVIGTIGDLDLPQSPDAVVRLEHVSVQS